MREPIRFADFQKNTDDWLLTRDSLAPHTGEKLKFSLGFGSKLKRICCLPGELMTRLSLKGDDHQALIWDIQQMPRAIEDPILAYTADGEINQIQWASTQPDWIGICYNTSLEILRV